MIARGLGVGAALLSPLFFPWPFVALVALGMALFEPLVPLATGLCIDALYYVPQTGWLPIGTIAGGAATMVAFLVRSRLKTDSIGE